MTRQAMLHNAVNLAQGFPDFSAPAEIKQAAQQAVAADVNQYAITWGAKNLRNAIARQMGVWQGIAVDPEKEITVCCGSTEAMISTLLAVCNAGDEIVIFEPFYENYGPDSVLSGAKPKFVKLHPPTTDGGEWTFDENELRRAFHKHTKAIILNTPNNPTGKVFTRPNWNSSATSASSSTCSPSPTKSTSTSSTKAPNISPWCRSTACASAPSPSTACQKPTASPDGASDGRSRREITNAIRKVHDFLTVGAPAPLQEAGAAALACLRNITRNSPRATAFVATASCPPSPQPASNVFVRAAPTM